MNAQFSQFSSKGAELVQTVIRKLRRGKHAGLDVITEEHLCIGSGLLASPRCKLVNK